MNTIQPFCFNLLKIRKYLPLSLLVIVLLIATGCAVGAAPPAVVCESLKSGIYTIRLIGGAFVLITGVLLAINYLGQKILKSSVALGGTILALVVGVVLLATAPQMASTFLTLGGGTMPDIVALCSIS